MRQRTHKYSLPVGRVIPSPELADHYELDERRIGSGSFGHVFSVARPIPPRQVAIKKVLIFDPEQKERLDTEACIMKDLDHPNICKLMATYEKGRFMFFVMEYCKGKDVLERLMSLDEQKFGEHQAAKIVHQTALALHYAQKRGIAHRDVKPENLVFVSDEESDSFVKVVDWGLSSYCGERKMRSAVGSYVYCAPEILAKKLSRNSKSYTASCDLWSLGILIYVLLCGHPPFRGDATQLLKMAKEEKLIPQDDIWKALSREAKHLIQGTPSERTAERANCLLRVKPEKRLKFEEAAEVVALGRRHWLPLLLQLR
ncbi:Calcium-dependent protein kinase 5 (PfCDPK5) [Durusdinium trenchii]|uniref:Calcium-dependent protein kinase 5 (PfCDPK5) n=1 Tax=Durusdinium trenchii TaxID=1381693 RepID=A0ABP0Q9W3_9DINO